MEGFYTVTIYDDKNNIVDYFTRTDIGVFRGMTISHEYSVLMPLEDLEKTIIDELKSPYRRYEVFIDLYLAAIEPVVSDRFKHFFKIEIELFNPQEDSREIKMKLLTISAYLEKEFRRVEQDIAAGAMVI